MRVEHLSKHIQSLTEMPQFTRDTEFNFDKEDKNYQEAENLMAEDGKRLLKSFGNMKLYTFQNQYFIIKDSEFGKPIRLVYFMQYEVNRHFGRDCVQQIVVWRDNIENTLKDISGEIFFNILLKKYKTAITDKLQTSSGKAFWQNRIADSFNSGYNVYYADLSTNDLIKVNNPSEMFEIVSRKEPWGNSKTNQDRRFVITSIPFRE
jgi:hypothetical protein